MQLSVVTYTYNDAAYAAGLLRSLDGWGLPLAERIVVDDASDPPAVFPDSPGIILLRQARNLGPARAKVAGLARARGDVLVSVDCDIRPHRQFVRHALALLADPGVGLVGAGSIRYAGQLTPATRWENWQAARYRSPDDAVVAMVRGGVFLMRRDVYEAVGGVSAEECAVAEDVRLSRAVAGAGYAVMAVNAYPVSQLRPLSVAQLCKQQVTYFGYSRVLRVMNQGLDWHVAVEAQAFADILDRLEPAEALLAVVPLCKLAAMELFVRERLARTACPLAVLDGLGRDICAIARQDPRLLGLVAATWRALGLTPAPWLGASAAVGFSQPALARAAAWFARQVAGNPALDAVVAADAGSFHYLDAKGLAYGDYIGFEKLARDREAAAGPGNPDSADGPGRPAGADPA